MSESPKIAKQWANRADKPAPRRARRWWIVLGVTLTMFAAGFTVAAFVLFPARPAAEDLRIAPSLIGRTVDEATATASDEGFEIAVGAPVAHPDVPKGTVFAQSPLAGQEIRRGGTIQVTVSAGPEPRLIPDVRGIDADQARRILEGNGFQVTIDTVSGEARAGSVVGSQPAPGDTVPATGAIRISVSRGKVAADASGLPSVVGLTMEAARARLEGAGFQVGVSFDATSRSPTGTVLSQTPVGGTAVPPGTTISIVVSSGS